jgi:calcineurin-like phosphoesterase family protein
MNVFLVSDTHFGHEATCTKFTKPDGSPLRPFANAEEMNEALVLLWNEVVRPDDIVYHLGDVVMSHRHLPIVSRLNGKKHLIAGNHDPLIGKKAKKFNFADYFETVGPLKEWGEMIFTHVPLHPACMTRWKYNVHGHLHANEIMLKNYHAWKEEERLVPDPRYLCVSIEHTDFKPIALEDVQARLKQRDKVCIRDLIEDNPGVGDV